MDHDPAAQQERRRNVYIARNTRILGKNRTQDLTDFLAVVNECDVYGRRTMDTAPRRPREHRYEGENFSTFSVNEGMKHISLINTTSPLFPSTPWSKKMPQFELTPLPNRKPADIRAMQQKCRWALWAFEQGTYLQHYVEMHEPPSTRSEIEYHAQMQRENDKIVDFFDNDAGRAGIDVLVGTVRAPENLDEMECAIHIIDRMEKFPDKKEFLYESRGNAKHHRAYQRLAYAIFNAHIAPNVVVLRAGEEKT